MRRSVAALSVLFASTLIAAGATVPASAAVVAPAVSASQAQVSVVGYWNLDHSKTTVAALKAYDVPMSLDIDEKYDFTARVGCNAVFGNVTLAPQDGLAVFADVAATQMECDQVAMDAEAALKTMLDGATLTYVLTEHELTFTNAAGDVLAYTR